MGEDDTKKIKSYLVYFSFIAIMGGNTGNILDLVRPPSIENKYRQDPFTSKMAHEMEDRIMTTVRNLHDDCDGDIGENEDDLRDIRTRIGINEARLQDCLNRLDDLK